MAFSGSFMCTSFKVDILCARHNFQLSGGNTFRTALYTNSATFDANTVAYTSSNEVAGTAYVAKGNALTRVNPTFTGTTAWLDFADTIWATSTITARGALLYNDDTTTPVADATVAVLDFGSDKVSAAGDFTIQFPVADFTNAIIRIA
jgi:hypothetical protein